MTIELSLQITDQSQSFQITLKDILDATDYDYSEKEWSELDNDKKAELLRETAEYLMDPVSMSIDWEEN
jgi:hypothetical protein